jgi:hypothetical protein
VTEELVSQSVELPDGALRVLQPREAAELPDAGAVEWAPIAPYWAVLWRSGVALARELGSAGLGGRRIVELGCGLAVPSLAAARAGATVLATDACPADVLYDRASVAPLLSLLPRPAPETWLADPGRPAAGALLEAAVRRWRIDARIRGVVRVHRLRLRCRPPHRTTR